MVKKGDGSYMPAYASDYENAKRHKVGALVEGEFREPRHPIYHKKFFALLNLGFSNQEKYSIFDHYRAVFTMKAGYYEEIRTEKGVIYLPKSISFANMDQIEFEKLYQAMIDVLLKELGGITKREIEDQIIHFI
jgi:hypothetical protein